MIRFTQLSLLVFAYLLIDHSCYAQVKVSKTNEQWQLLIDEQPFNIKGVTFGYDQDVANYDSYFSDLQNIGVNTIRLWATNDNTKLLLDSAHKYDIKVMVGIWMRHGRPGMEDDDSFNYLKDKEGMQAMYDNALEVVNRYKDHPAVLTWGIGNEVYLNMATDPEKEAYSKLLERICSAIKAVDTSHPITSVEAWTFGLDWWEKHVPSIDIYGLNSYGPGAGFLQEELDKRDIDKPYIITEFGVTGEWDITEKPNGIALEPTDQHKYHAITQGYKEWIQPKPKCLGVYIFHYGTGNNFATSWLLTHYNEYYRPQYWAIREAYTGKTPTNKVPVINAFSLVKQTSESGNWIPVDLAIEDSENDEMTVSFHYNQRTGSRKRRNSVKPLEYRGSIAEGFQIRLPQEDGAIKVYVHVTDSFKNMGIATTSTMVSDEIARARKYLVPKVELPFYVYQDGIDVPYAPTAFMGNYKSLSVDVKNTEEVYAGKYAMKIKYDATKDWYGIGLVDPANDWGEILGGYDISEAKTFSFWARTKDQNINVKVGFGLIGNDKPYPDTSKSELEITLTPKWKKYSIKAKKLDLSCIRSGFVLFFRCEWFQADDLY